MTDAERLDWLDRNPATIVHRPQGERSPIWPAWEITPYGWQASICGHNVRSAIDKAAEAVAFFAATPPETPE